MSPDWSASPSPVPYATLGDPQSLNLYGYVRNHPLSLVDADGHRETSLLFGGMDPLWDGNGSGGNGGSAEEQEAEQRHNSIIWNDYDPEGIAHDRVGYVFTGGDGSRFDRDKQYVALAVGQQAAIGKSPEEVKKEIQYMYDNLTTSNFYGPDANGLHGGNWNFNVIIGGTKYP